MQQDSLYINGVGCISPQITYFRDEFLNEIQAFATDKMLCKDPDYTQYLDAGSVRRMSRLLKFGTSAGLMTLRDAGVSVPGAISTGTGFGLLDLSQKFLASIIETNEGVVSPTSFILSTHNTVSSNIALVCGCHAHNNTFTQRGFSFESALYDARMLSAEGVDNVLVGAYDEVGQFAHAKFKKAGELRQEPCSNLDIFGAQSSGIIMGEGAAFFVLSIQRSAESYGQLMAHDTLFSPTDESSQNQWVENFLRQNGLTTGDVDVVVLGISGAKAKDEMLIGMADKFFADSTTAAFKHLCGEYMTSSAFAFWLSAKMMKTAKVPQSVVLQNKHRAPRLILVCNYYKQYHSLMLFKSC